MKHSTFFRHTTLCLSLSLWAASVNAQEPAPELPVVKHRVMGLFLPERQDDLRSLFAESIPEVKLVSIDYANAEAMFQYDAAKLFNRPKPEQVIERFDNLVRMQSRATFGIRPLSTLPKDKMQRVEIAIVGLDCKACCLSVYETLMKIDGVEQATASFRDGRAVAWIDPAKTDAKALEEALRKKNVTIKTP